MDLAGAEPTGLAGIVNETKLTYMYEKGDLKHNGHRNFKFIT